MSIAPRAAGPTAIFSMYVSGACRKPPSSAAAMTESEFWPPVAQIVVPSSGSSAMSILGPAARADLLADVEHGRLVALALADHDRAVHLDLVERRAHGVDRRLVRRLLVAAAHHVRAGQRRGFRRTHQLQRQVPVHRHGIPSLAVGSLRAEALLDLPEHLAAHHVVARGKHDWRVREPRVDA